MDRKFFLDYYLDEQGALEFDKNGLLRVKRIGTGFMMIQRHVLETMISNIQSGRTTTMLTTVPTAPSLI
jgi:hypothetical protein